jgi:nucleoside-diphosphate-sugar epimerase
MASRRALILGGTGQIGLATATRLLTDGWEVQLASRGRTAPTAPLPDGARPVTLDRDDAGALRNAATGVDLLVDAVCYSAEQARGLTALGDSVGALSVISTLSVYADAAGRGFETDGDFPEYPQPITESQPRLPAGDTGYSDRKVAVEDELFTNVVVPLTITRPGAVYGRGSVHPRELWALLRARAHRPTVILAHGGLSRFQPSASATIAEIIVRAAELPGTHVYNAVDATAPTVRELVAAVAAACDHTWAEVLLPGEPVGEFSRVGETPWSVPKDVVASDALARSELGYEPSTDYVASMPDLVSWLTETIGDRDWRTVFPDAARMEGPNFDDFAAEDTFLRRRAATA